MKRPLRLALLPLFLLGGLPLTRAYAQWTPPTPEELSMTAQSEVPGAPAVYLFREEKTDDHLHMFDIYVRIKVLTERGKEYANVDLPYATSSEGGGMTVENIEARTIHPDGKVILFTGKPLQKVIEKAGEIKVMKKVFTLPDVEIGSILEYRYKLRGDDGYFTAPQWYIQSDLFTRKAHYVWRPTDKQLISSDDRGELTSTIAWTPILPEGTVVKQTHLPPLGPQGIAQTILEVNVHDIMPSPQEELMPPLRSFTYRVLFYYSPYRTGEEFWKKEGNHWAKLQDKFIGPGPRVAAEVQKLTAPGDTQEAKLKKIYAAVMALENTDFTRQHSRNEEKAAGLSQLRNTDDLLDRKRGTGDQLAALFVAMARSAGMKAYLMAVTNRDRSLFLPSYMSLRQLDDDIAIVNVDGKEQFFDPGSRFSPYGHLSWKHTYTRGVRQVDGGTTVAASTGEAYTYSRVQRIVNLTLDEQGVATGTVKLSFTGSPALNWRQDALRTDETSLNHDLQTAVERMLPGGMEVKVASVDKLTDYEQPLVVVCNVKGPIGSPTGKRLLITGDLLEGNTRPLFPHDKRELPVYFEFGQIMQDAIRINFPATFAVESLPQKENDQYLRAAAYELKSESTPTSITIRRNYTRSDIIFPVAEYPEFRTFYSKMETKDQEPIVLGRAAAKAELSIPKAP